MRPGYDFNLALIICTIITIAGLFSIAIQRIEIDFDVVSSLPTGDPVIADAKFVIRNHPIQDQMVIDVSHQKNNTDVLVEGGERIIRKLTESGLFQSVGLKETGELIPGLILHISQNLPVMFTERELDETIAPLLEFESIRARLKNAIFKLASIDGIGQVKLISNDPLELRNIVMKRLAHLAPSQKAWTYKGHLISADNRHLLIIANPKSSGTDTAFSRAAVKLLGEISVEMNRVYQDKGYRFTLTPVGAYRAALDNELTARKDTRLAIIFSTIGIALLLVLSFPRPLMGLMSLVPAVAGTVTAFFVFSLLYSSVSILALGFGGAIISITVDHGIAYFLFLDRPFETSGRNAAREIRAIGLLTVLTTVGAFLTLSISGFPILAQIGQFAALGIAFSFAFIHTVLPGIFPVMPPAKRKRDLPLQKIVDKLAHSGGMYKVVAAFALATFMLFFARPEFNTDLKSINTVSEETIAAENLVSQVWGNVFSKVFLMLEGDSIAEIQEKGDRVSALLEQDVVSGSLSSAFSSSQIFPGNERGKRNFSAWKRFWDPERTKEFKRVLGQAALEFGFSPNAFNPFYKAISDPQFAPDIVPAKYFALTGISRNSDKTKWIQFSTLTPGEYYRAEEFFAKYTSVESVKVFDSGFFAERFGELLFSTFLKMILIIGLCVVILLFVFFLDWKLTFISMLPVLFALICTLGTLKLIGHPLDIPGLMLAIVVIGMGIDYSLFFVRSYQRYNDEKHASLGLVRSAVFLASASTLIGFGVLSFADHALLKSAGLISLLGIGYSLMGAFAILPPLLRRVFDSSNPGMENKVGIGKNRSARVVKRYAYLEAFVRLFARFKILLDPMFPELERFFEEPETIIDIGCGYGVPACWLLDRFPNAEIHGMDPDPESVRIASRAVGTKGKIIRGSAPDVPELPGPADAALMLDMIHYLNDVDLTATLRILNERLRQNGRLIIRITIPVDEKFSWWRWIENIRISIRKENNYFRPLEDLRPIITQAGFEIIRIEPSGSDREEIWIIAEKQGHLFTGKGDLSDVE
ncbi:MAG: methyltransferase domain-containing protein [Proteobacteria bacterium]|nr:methyltransferase domain-containing protein [Pseudomonadota bacterium]